MTEPTPERVPVLAFAYEVIVGDLIVDAWEGTEREVADVLVTARDVTITFADGTTETTTQRPGRQVIYDVLRLRSALPAEDEAPALDDGVPAEDEALDDTAPTEDVPADAVL